MYKNHRLAGFKRHISQLVAIWSPRGRNNGLTAVQGALGVLTIGIGHPQIKIFPIFGDVCNTGAKNA